MLVYGFIKINNCTWKTFFLVLYDMPSITDPSEKFFRVYEGLLSSTYGLLRLTLKWQNKDGGQAD